MSIEHRSFGGVSFLPCFLYYDIDHHIFRHINEYFGTRSPSVVGQGLLFPDFCVFSFSFTIFFIRPTDRPIQNQQSNALDATGKKRKMALFMNKRSLQLFEPTCTLCSNFKKKLRRKRNITTLLQTTVEQKRVTKQGADEFTLIRLSTRKTQNLSSAVTVNGKIRNKICMLFICTHDGL